MKTRNFEVDGVKYQVRLPNHAERREGRRLYNKVFKELIDDGAPMTEQVGKIAKEKGLWTDEDEADYRANEKEIRELETKLEEGGIELNEAKKIADEISTLRFKLRLIDINFNSLYDMTAQSQASSMEREFYLARCILDEKGKPVFKNLDDFYDRLTEPLVLQGATEFAMLLSGQTNYIDSYKELPENKFLIEFGFLNEDLTPKEDETPKKKERKPFLRGGIPIKEK